MDKNKTAINGDTDTITKYLNHIFDYTNTENLPTDQDQNKDINNYGAFIIGVAGGSAGGKTTVADAIFKIIGIDNCLLLSMDSYYKSPTEEDRKNLAEYNFDHPNALDLDLVYTHLLELSKGRSIQIPVYNFNVSKREDHTTEVFPSKLIILEGILGLYDSRLRDLMQMKIFVDSDADVRLARRSNI
jgi:uridine kinase